jgi:hypothetical protein
MSTTLPAVTSSTPSTFSLAAVRTALLAAGVTLSPAELAGLPGWYMAGELASLIATGQLAEALAWVAFYRAERSHPIYG